LYFSPRLELPLDSRFVISGRLPVKVLASVKKNSCIWLLVIVFMLVGCGESTDPFPSPTAAQTAQQAPAELPSSPGVDAADAAQNTNTPAQAQPAERIGADNALIRYTGRFDTSDPARPAFDWPAVTIEAAFEGTSLAVLLQDGKNLYNVYVDGQPTILVTHPGQERYVLAEGLRDGEHRVRLTKRTETFYGTPVFLGFELDAGRGLLALPPTSGRRIEFIGDSITAGYGSEGQSPTCVFSPATENVELTYAAQTAADLDAEYTVIAVSGVGIVRNYNTEGKMSAGTMLTYYEGTTADTNTASWNFSNWVPNAVVINLGTNDFSTAPHPAGEVFLQGYTQLIVKVRNRYPQAHIFAVAGPIMVDPAEATIRSVVTQMREVLGDERVHFVKIENSLELSGVDYGCDWHPNASGHRKIAGQLTPIIAGTMGW
jgi:lysophospholipase L1-like esterase